MSGLPDMSDALSDWQTELFFQVVDRGMDDFEVKVTRVADEPFEGVLQPIVPTKLLVKPEGERTWRWFTLTTQQKLALQTTVIGPEGRTFRVVSVQDWDSFKQYELVEKA